MNGLLVGRVWQPVGRTGPIVVLFDSAGVFDLSNIATTVSALLEQPDLPRLRTRIASHKPLCSIRHLLGNAQRTINGDPPVGPYLLAPCDLQVIKACGVTFAASAPERVVEERARGNPAAADEARHIISEYLGNAAKIAPGSEAASELKRRLLALGMWSQYLEVAFGPDAEIFTKAASLSAVGHGVEVGIHRMSHWNNPEPEVVVAVNSRSEVVGATLANDVNLRDVEGRSALLLGKAKDNNGACAIGPALRLFDATFTLDHVRAADVSLEVTGSDGFHLQAHSSMREISRDPLELVRQVIGPHHQYPDGLMLFLGTLFAPVQDRDGPGLGFTHHIADRVAIQAPGLGCLVKSRQLLRCHSPVDVRHRATVQTPAKTQSVGRNALSATERELT
jgi:fumarylacetoacetate (FAA) hydrolase family protein